MNSKLEVKPPVVANKTSKSQWATNARRNNDAWFLSRHGLVCEGKVLELPSLTPERLKAFRHGRPHNSIRVRGQWYYDTNALVELVEISNCLKGRP